MNLSNTNDQLINDHSTHEYTKHKKDNSSNTSLLILISKSPSFL